MVRMTDLLKKAKTAEAKKDELAIAEKKAPPAVKRKPR